jgi:serpin B
MENDSDSAYRVVNAIWRNESLPGAFRPDYVNAVSQSLRAEADSAPAAELTQAVNDWVNEQTNGLIPKLLNHAADSNAILVNALYLKSGWLEPFQTKGAGDFTAVDGTVVQKEYMEHTNSYLYFEDEGCQLVSIPLVGGVSMIFVLGDADNLPQKLSQAYYTKVHVTVPTFDLETSFENGELVSFLCALGCDRMFGSKAEFGKMFTDALCVDDIIQKTKVHIYEEGLEAAAATGMVMKNTSMPNPDQPKESQYHYPNDWHHNSKDYLDRAQKRRQYLTDNSGSPRPEEQKFLSTHHSHPWSSGRFFHQYQVQLL